MAAIHPRAGAAKPTKRSADAAAVWPPLASDITRAAVGLAKPATLSGFAPQATSSAWFLRRIAGPRAALRGSSAAPARRLCRAAVGLGVDDGVSGAVEHQQQDRRSCWSRARATRGAGRGRHGRARPRRWPWWRPASAASYFSRHRITRAQAAQNHFLRSLYAPGLDPALKGFQLDLL